MTTKTVSTLVLSIALAFAMAALPTLVCNAQETRKSSELLQVGEMHEVIGQQQHQGRVSLAKIIDMPHFYGVGALEGLRGEITILDFVAVITGVTRDGRPERVRDAAAKATMLIGQSVEHWTETAFGEGVPHDQFEKRVAALAAGKGIDVTEPFVFVIEGEFRDVRLHVINGACPIRARMKKAEMDNENQPLEFEAEKLKGKLVGIYAADSAGKLTHPGTSVHAHLIYLEEKTGHRITGHLERVGLAKNAVLKLADPAK